MQQRTLGRSNLHVSAMGLGCWAIGGVCWSGGQPSGWGQVDDDQSIAAIRAGLDLGINFIDTANSYGAGHSECVVGQAIKGRRDQVVIATKFGNVISEARREVTGTSADPAYIRSECDASLRRLGTDHIDLYQFHINRYDGDAAAVRDILEELVAAGKVRWYGWSTDDPARARVFAAGAHCASVQHRLHVLCDAAEMLDLCDQVNLASINKTPLASGLLSGKFTAASTFAADDNRRGWNLRDGQQAEQLRRLEQVRAELTTGGRTLVQGALGWIWARSPRTIPIPGFRNRTQVAENAAALNRGPLPSDTMARIAQLLAPSA